MNNLSSKSPIFYPPSPQGGVKKKDGIQSPPLGGFRGLTLQGLGGVKRLGVEW